jgi:hypothetical protein
MKNLKLFWDHFTPTDDDDPTFRLTAILDGKPIYIADRFTPEECYTELLEKLGYSVEEEHWWEDEENYEDSN